MPTLKELLLKGKTRVTGSLRSPASPAAGQENVPPVSSAGIFPIPSHSFETPQNPTPRPLGDLPSNALDAQPVPSPTDVPDINIDPYLLLEDNLLCSPGDGDPSSTNRADFQQGANEEPHNPTAMATGPQAQSANGGQDSSFRSLPDPFTSDVSADRSYLWAKHHATLHKLKPDSAKEMLMYAKYSMEERQFAFYGLMLHLRDLYMFDPSLWSPNTDATTNIKSITRTLLLSPVLSYYKGTASLAVMFVLGRVQVPGLPLGWNEHESMRRAVQTVAITELSQMRSDMKKIIYQSTRKKTQANIGVLTERLIGSLGIKVTSAHWGRFAFVRKMALDHRKTSNNKFWDLVDRALAELRRDAMEDSKGNLIIAREIITESLAEVLEADQKNFGAPTRNSIFMDRVLSKTQEETEDASRKILAGMGGNIRKRGREEDDEEDLDEDDDPFTATTQGQSDYSSSWY